MTMMKISDSFKQGLVGTKEFNMLTTVAGYSIRDSNNIVMMIDLGNYLQIIYDYGIKCIRLIVAYYEEESEYEKCAAIKLAIDNYNKSTGANLNIK